MTAKERLVELLPVISEGEAERMILALEEEREDHQAFQEGLREAELEGTIPWEQIKMKLGLNL